MNLVCMASLSMGLSSSLWIGELIFVYIFCLISLTYACHYLIMLIKYTGNLWIILKEHNNFCYLWKFGPKYSTFEEILFEKSHWFMFLPPSNFKLDYLYSICNWMQRAENNFLVQIPKIMQFIWLSNFNLYIRRHLLWDNWHGNEQKCKQRHQQRFAYRAPACCSGGRCFESFRELKDIFLLSNL